MHPHCRNVLSRVFQIIIISFTFVRLEADVSPLIAIGDTVQISIEEDAGFSFRGPVDSSGTVNLPFIGEFEVAGDSVETIRLRLSTILEEEYYWKATVSLSIVERAAASVYIYGAVKEPGIVKLPPAGELTIAQALVSVQGLTAWADPDSAYILRKTSTGETQKIEFSIRDVLSQDQAEDSLKLQNFDEFFVQGIGRGDAGLLMTNDQREVIVVGQVNSPGVIRFSPGEEATLMRAVFKAGGLTRFARGDRIKLIRYAGNNRMVEEVDLDIIIEEGYLEKDRTLLPGDMIIVQQKFINL